MKTLVWCSSVIPATPSERRSGRPIGRDIHAFQSMLRNYEDIARWADAFGMDGFGSAEHHFPTEGGENLPNSLLLYAKLAAQTRQIMFAPMPIVLSAHNSLRVAEDLAMFTHMFPGRLGVSFAYGYQTPGMQTLTQDEAVVSGHPGSDTRNREIFDECLSIVERAWAEDSFQHKGKHYQVPHPVDEDGTACPVGVVPKPVHRPTIFIPAGASPQTVIDAARSGRTLLLTAGSREKVRSIAELYRDTARANGRDLRLGEGTGIVTKLFLGDTFDEAFDLAVQTSGHWYQDFLQTVGCTAGLRATAEGAHRPLCPDDARALTRSMHAAGRLLCGTADQVRDQMKDVQTVYGGGELDWFVWEYWAQALPGVDAPDIQREQLKTYAEQIMPAFR
ncbi:flavin-dependent oxidoreductase, F420-dependent methylene-tetrahydromethanopterin reductase [Streptomyces lincolnensis]|uniref:Flavin-dependent oxidoreductase, F420-dependent methylene-tetrahydromethanopterin reductase n=1 Tax=Streptomyces lincolnensis TaxID=1915 RepID=A0A1B1M307_STRLN|nr:LLM class flavin-dependent oxidoreductase [Streptomyces lincolnensis]ANS62807.1 flavin-dependent oxidoreductase, F420-dependent methylene-tetrahydromethanopterin reductase [Streptomyces lincolnensis]AXG51731.1 flavin-dependent oxidoreductase, F420-dependent methylene-tetrahydromethanopterin reductase [Streptomyces lincolnensis]QMV04750.1 LLM class flavin-dependent oxidoreductase [Streptomyces lincolnensis]